MDLQSKRKKIKKAVFPAGGSGTRFLPASKVVPKEMLTVFDRPMIQYAVEEAKSAGIEEFLFVISRGKTLIEDHFDNHFELEYKLKKNNKHQSYDDIKSPVPHIGTMFSVRQQEALGLGHAVACAKHFVNNEPFAVILPDELLLSKPGSLKSVLKNMIKMYEAGDGNDVIMAAQQVSADKVSAYGVFDVESENGNTIIAKGIVEKPSLEDAPSNYVSIGRYILPPQILDILQNTPPSVNGEIQLTDAIDKLLKVNNTKITAYSIDEDAYRFDCGQPLGLLKASLSIAKMKGVDLDKI